MKHYFLLYQNCRLVQGAARSIIADLQRYQYHIVPNGMATVLHTLKDIGIEDTLHTAGEDEREVIQEYIAFLEQHDLGWRCDAAEKERFPDLLLQWDSPFTIANLIIDMGQPNGDLSDYKNIGAELRHLGVYALQLRCFAVYTLPQLLQVLSLFGDTRLRHIELVLPYHASFTAAALDTLRGKRPAIGRIVFTQAPEADRCPEAQDVSYTSGCLTPKHCGVVHPSYFTINIPHFTESLQHNSCLNRKMSIDTEGYIRNCPSMPEQYGHIKDTSLTEALSKQGFTQYWHITKDEIAVCKDCEFRYICTDCRAFTEAAENPYSKPLKCGYDPYTCTWENWSRNPLKQAAMASYAL